MSRDSHTTLGSTMIILAWVIIIGMLAAVFAKWEGWQRNPNQHPDSVVTQSGERRVILKPNRNHHYVVTGTINGHEAQFMLDTGATVVSIPGYIADNMGLSRGHKGYAETASDVIEVYSTTIAKLTIGDIVLTDIRASIMPDSQAEYILLGMSALRNLDFTQSRDSLTLIQQ